MNKARLVIQKGGYPGTAFELAPGATLIGRNPSTDITLVDEGISREHAVIEWEDGACSIEDLQSTNGTKVNGTRIRSVELKEGDEIQMGRTVLVFHNP